jgi:hypothetical protein
MRELISGLEQRRIATWLDAKGALCLPHGLGMRDQASGAPLQLINKMLERRRSEVEIALKAFVVSEENAGLQQGGALGRAAEFLVAQRGIGLRLNCCESPIGRQST